MSKLISNALLLGSFFLVFQSCRKDTDFDVIEEERTTNDFVETVKSYPGVDRELWIYFQRFENEGIERGINIDLIDSEITGIISNIEQEHVAGLCNYSSNAPEHVTIDTDFWESASDLYKEFVVYHELGHCYLARAHREAEHADGTCASLMRSGLGTCKDNYNSVSRADYLDELFDPNHF